MTQNLGLKTQEKYLPQVDELQIIIINVRDGLLQWMSKYLNPKSYFQEKGSRSNKNDQKYKTQSPQPINTDKNIFSESFITII